MPEPTLEERIAKERRRRLRHQPWHYWIRSGRTEPPQNEYFCEYCAGWFGVPHSHHERGFCLSMGRKDQCACIDCWVYDGRSERAAPKKVSGLVKKMTPGQKARAAAARKKSWEPG